MRKSKPNLELFAADIPLVDGIIESITLLPDQAKIYFRTENGASAAFTFEQTAGVWEKRAAGQEIGGMTTQPIHLAPSYIRDSLLADLETGELDQETLDSLSVYSFLNSWSEQPLLEIAAVEMKIDK
ncbi:hypothetical protein [Paenibacillus bovis]|uniref:Uncharacterized protein n=1 Tax=Paenibacillus bovis TaxID=1616788 RepID=A0A172ZH29_9BACL|nr:hypothetical protein [Paenibacillus bovis]ANF96712.1 hypothetical protein AR543_12295 [Paenibacillus bovis]